MFKIKTILALSAAILLVPTPAKAEWVRFGSYDDVQTYIETDSISYKGRQGFFTTQNLNVFPDYDGAIRSLSRQSIDCLSGTRYYHRFIGFSKSGRVVYDEVQTSSAPPAQPGTLGARIYNFVCRQ